MRRMITIKDNEFVALGRIKLHERFDFCRIWRMGTGYAKIECEKKGNCWENSYLKEKISMFGVDYPLNIGRVFIVEIFF